VQLTFIYTFARVLEEKDKTKRTYANSFIEALLIKDVAKMKESLNAFIQGVPTYRPEAFYQGFVAAILSFIDEEEYAIQVEPESGKGRADIILKTILSADEAFIFELKVQRKGQKAILEGTGIKQIQQKNYQQLLQREGYRQIYYVEIFFASREVTNIKIEKQSA
jgi:hypothetical protein